MTSPRSVVFANPARTAIGTFGGSLQEIAAPNLGAAAIKAAIERAGLKPDEVGTVAMGNVIQAGTRMNPARQAAIHGGLPVSVPAMTVNRVCGSGAQAIVSAAQEIILGSVDVAVAGGMENMDLAPYLIARLLGVGVSKLDGPRHHHTSGGSSALNRNWDKSEVQDRAGSPLLDPSPASRRMNMTLFIQTNSGLAGFLLVRSKTHATIRRSERSFEISCSTRVGPSRVQSTKSMATVR